MASSYNMDLEARRVEDSKEEDLGSRPFETKCHSISVGCNNKWFRIDINPVVTIASAVIIWALVIWCMVKPEQVRRNVFVCLFVLKVLSVGHIHMSYYWGHWYPCFGFLVTSPLGFKARVGSALFALRRRMYCTFPEIPWVRRNV